MFGFIIGVAASFGAYAYFRRHRGHYRDHGRYGHRGRHGCGRHGRGRRGWGGRWVERIADLIDASPEQERVISDAARELRRDLEGMRDEGKASRRDLADAFGPERLDEERLGELFARHDERLTEARKSVVGALAKVHDALDPDQRQRLARWLARRGPMAGPYR
ncbi:hypothetical protein PPSIR1_27333 [Plesiocystis pacifica SIR-1]|uniref:Periplasmic heavy metal sensor n=1 Tax=Plesiocystis pacifica SIR-1 TaxID=391625 RepID=A6G4N1_9BACT|nr:periplasmic heavy metal sensor [Plesiocystis pacifica]EDM79151.1 hypothetical protein PPSIR1_27333 [Plesiocystis pacifica SIR-1]